MANGGGIDEEVAAAGVGEDEECRRCAAPGSDSLDEEQQGDEAELPVHSDALLEVYNNGNDGAQELTAAPWLGFERDEARSNGERNGEVLGREGGSGQPYPGSGVLGLDEDGAGRIDRGLPRSLQRRKTTTGDFYTEPPATFKFLTKRSLATIKLSVFKNQQQYSAVFGARINF